MINDLDQEVNFKVIRSYIDALDTEARAIQKQTLSWKEQALSESWIIIQGQPGHYPGSFSSEQQLDRLTLLYDNIIWVEPWTMQLVPVAGYSSKQFIDKIGVLLEQEIILPVGGYYTPAESWTELKARESVIWDGLDHAWHSYSGLMNYEVLTHKCYEPLVHFCRAFDTIVEKLLKSDRVFSFHYYKTYSDEKSGSEPPSRRYGFWDLKRLALTRYVFDQAFINTVYSASGVLSTYADVIFHRVKTLTVSTDNRTQQLVPFGKEEILVPIVAQALLRLPEYMTPDDILSVRSTEQGIKLREAIRGAVTNESVIAKSVDKAAESLCKKSHFSSQVNTLTEVSIVSMVTAAGYAVGGLPGAIIGSVGAIPIKKITGCKLKEVFKKSLHWLYGSLTVRK